MPFINMTKNFVFIGNARTGSTSVYKFLNEKCKNDKIIWEDSLGAKPYLYHMSIQDTIKKYPFCKDYLFFCYVRNPYTRFISSYFEFTVNKCHHVWSNELLNYKDFREFCLNFNDTEIKNDIHFKPLSEQIKCDLSINLHVCRFENFSEDFNIVANIKNIPNQITVHSRKTKYSKQINDFYDEEMKTIIQNFYKDDFVNFNYSIDIINV